MQKALYGVLSRDAEGYKDLVLRAREESDEELAEFFERVVREDAELAREARRLLSERVPE